MHLTDDSGVIRIEQDSEATSILLSGIVTAEHAAQLLDACRSACRSDRTVLTIDFASVERIDGCILQVLVALKAALPPAEFRLTAIPPPVREWLALAGAESMLAEAAATF